MFVVKDGEKRVLGDFDTEMRRRRALGLRNRWFATVQTVLALVLLWFGIQPLELGHVHEAAIMGGLLWLFLVSEGSSNQLADELDLLEHRIVERLQPNEIQSGPRVQSHD